MSRDISLFSFPRPCVQFGTKSTLLTYSVKAGPEMGRELPHAACFLAQHYYRQIAEMVVEQDDTDEILE